MSRNNSETDSVAGLAMFLLVATAVVGVLYITYHKLALMVLVCTAALALMMKVYKTDYWDNYTYVELACFIPIFIAISSIVNITYPAHIVSAVEALQQYDGMGFISQSLIFAWNAELNIKVIVFCHIIAFGLILAASISNALLTNHSNGTKAALLSIVSISSLLMANLSFVPSWVYNYFQV